MNKAKDISAVTTLLTVDETAKVLRVSPKTVIRRCDKGELPYIKAAGGRSARLITLAAVTDWIASNTVGPRRKAASND